MSPKTLMALACLLLLAGIPLITGEGLAQRDEPSPPRTLYLERDTYYASVNSFSRTEGAPWFKFQMNSLNDLEVRAAYGFNSEERDGFGMGVRFLALIEYNDAGSNDMYDEDEDRVVSFYPLSASALKSDYLRKANDWNRVKWDPSARIIENGSWDIDYARMYDRAFGAGWTLGQRIGSKDLDEGADHNPYAERRLGREEMKRNIDQFTQWLNDTAYPSETQDWLREAAARAFASGFYRGYEAAYDETAPDRTRGEGPINPEEGPDRSKVSNPAPRYRPLKIYRKANGDSAPDMVIEVRDNNNIFGIRCTISSDMIEIENGYLSPSSMKIDILIDGYPFVGRGTKLALLMDMGSHVSYSGNIDFKRMDSSWDQSNGLASDEEEVRVTTGNFSGFFSWVNHSYADGDIHPVKARVLNSVYGSYWDENGGKSTQNRGVLFSYPRARSIVHDPKLGFIEIEDNALYPGIQLPEPERGLVGEPAIYLMSFIAVALLIAATWRRKAFSVR
ncbi:MAG: hypothetical protein QCI82_04295 [Candidatus Thermoplasmatota archaeon]|nr:hypothetical protein [Candidatus Thermoplasmatota archaeon]